MRRWAVTGPIGAGKSAVTGLLAARGASIIDGDALGHEVLSDPAVVGEVRRAFGAGVVVGGAVDRRSLGRIVFADAQAMERLNALVHPPLAALMQRRLDAAAAGDAVLAVLEAAVYFLLPSPPPVDLVVAVTAPASLRAGRIASARGLDAVAVADRIAAQAAWEPLWRRADVTINNDGTPADLALAVDRLWTAHGPGATRPPGQGDPTP